MAITVEPRKAEAEIALEDQMGNGTTIYLSGPDIYYPDALRRGEEMKRLCSAYGCLGIYPLDGGPDGIGTRDKQREAVWIYRRNARRIDQSDAVLANLNAFRGDEPDSGTAFVVGYAVAKGIPVYGYLRDGRTLAERRGDGVDRIGRSVENYGLPVSLMLSIPTVVVIGGFEDALKRLIADESQRRDQSKERSGT